ncbi:hypothetical protein UA38_21260 [Photobacterium kishitanii]|uniref:Uncharacterized protein n=1 Tax=Photobacterium kishitanii TaxID=318456 RepID=A0AAX0YRD0_9GAMM|nr:hypothetical protein [Photobacterium kishitanii]KJG55140.1 hypothetical protein UA38_21260 [Photobacterium kishitanii]KJG57310.1 hypothetical protein UA42_21585 [Photobacterium kishitanii]KJG63495.1 hypothetical protein UA40_21650 [Photobacterium kishitanii]KJG69349.1 hypothetical protein UA41_11400 [Photobacterium kishitanii]PSX17606.1 hypothetical protein C0W70_19010 [Photobacterium kishitanii]
MATKTNFVKTSTGDVIAKSLIGACSHYPDHGVMILNIKGEKLLWISESDNEKARTIRDEINAQLMA